MSSKFVLFISLSAALSALLFVRCDYATTPDLNCVETASFEFFRVDTGLCASGCTYRFQATISGGDNLNYTWNFGDNQTSDEEAPEHRYAAPGTYQVSLVISQDACTNFVVPAQPLTIGFPAPVARITSAIPAVYTFPNTTVQFDAGMSTGAVSYLWDFGDGFTSNASAPSHPYSRPDTFMVVLQATGQGNDKDRDTLWVRVEPKTFLLTSNIDAAQFEWVVCTDEATDGSFNAAISTSVAMHTLKITSTGAVNGAGTVIDYPAGSAYINGAQNVYCARKTAAGYIIVGNVENTLNPSDINTDIFCLTLKPDFSIQSFPNPLFDNIPGVGNGNETGRYVIEHEGGFLIAGDQDFGSGGPPKRFYYLKVTNSLVKSGNAIVRSESTTFEQRRIQVIAANNSGFVVAGKKGTATFFTRLDADFNPVGTERNLGGFVASDLIKVDNNTYFLIGSDSGSGKVYKLDASGNDYPGWPVSIPNAVLNKGLITSKGLLAVAGGISNGSAYRPYLTQLRLTNGAAAVPVQNYPAGAASRRLYYVAQTRDDGFILGGEDETGLMLLIRTNHLGELIE